MQSSLWGVTTGSEIFNNLFVYKELKQCHSRVYAVYILTLIIGRKYTSGIFCCRFNEMED